MSTSFLPKWITTKVPLRVPWRAGSAWKSGAWRTVKPGRKCASSAGMRADEHVPHEERVPRVRRDEPDRNPIGRVGAAEEVLDEHLARIEIAANIVVQALEGRGVEPRILLQPDPIRGAGLGDDELVLGGAAGVRAGDPDERAVVGQLALAAAKGVLDQSGWRQVGENADGKEAVLDEGQALARKCCRLGTHTLLWRVTARQRTRPPSVSAALPAGIIGRFRARGNCAGDRVRAGPPPAWKGGGRGSPPSPGPARSAAGTDGSKYMRSLGVG